MTWLSFSNSPDSNSHLKTSKLPRSFATFTLTHLNLTHTLVNKVVIFHTYSKILTILGQTSVSFLKIIDLGSSRRDVILMKYCDCREALPRPNIALSSPSSPLFQSTFNHLLVVHVKSGVGCILFDCHGRVQSGMDI